MNLNAKNARPFGKQDQPRSKPEIPEGWTLGSLLLVGGSYHAWEITNAGGKRDVVFTKRNGK